MCYLKVYVPRWDGIRRQNLEWHGNSHSDKGRCQGNLKLQFRETFSSLKSGREPKNVDEHSSQLPFGIVHYQSTTFSPQESLGSKKSVGRPLTWGDG